MERPVFIDQPFRQFSRRRDSFFTRNFKEVPFDAVGVDEPSGEGLRTYGFQTRRPCVEDGAREGLTLQFEPVCRRVLLAEKGLDTTREAFPELR